MKKRERAFDKSDVVVIEPTPRLPYVVVVEAAVALRCLTLNPAAKTAGATEESLQDEFVQQLSEALQNHDVSADAPEVCFSTLVATPKSHFDAVDLVAYVSPPDDDGPHTILVALANT